LALCQGPRVLKAMIAATGDGSIDMFNHFITLGDELLPQLELNKKSKNDGELKPTVQIFFARSAGEIVGLKTQKVHI